MTRPASRPSKPPLPTAAVGAGGGSARDPDPAGAAEWSAGFAGADPFLPKVWQPANPRPRASTPMQATTRTPWPSLLIRPGAASKIGPVPAQGELAVALRKRDIQH